MWQRSIDKEIFVKLGFRIFSHSVRQLLLNLGPAFRISFVPFLLVIVVFSFLIPPDLSSWNGIGNQGIRPSGGMIFRVFLAMVAYTVLFIWVATAWHRFILLEEYPGAIFAKVQPGPMMAYFGASVRVFFAVMLVAIVVVLVMAFIGYILARITQVPYVLFLVNLVVQALISIIAMRMSVVLPAAAIGENMTIKQAMSVTANAKFAILVASILIVMLTNIPVFLMNTPLAPLVSGGIYQICASWLLTMLGISILTTLYGHFVEKRALM